MDQISRKQKSIHNLLVLGTSNSGGFADYRRVGQFFRSTSRADAGSGQEVGARFVKTFTKPIAKVTLIGHAWASLRRVLLALLVAWAFGILFGILNRMEQESSCVFWKYL